MTSPISITTALCTVRLITDPAWAPPPILRCQSLCGYWVQQIVDELSSAATARRLGSNYAAVQKRVNEILT